MALKMHGKHLPAISARKPLRSKFVTSIHSVFSRWSAGATHLSTKTAPLRSLVLLSVLCGFAANAHAQARGVGGGFRHLPPPQPPLANGFFGWPGVYVVERVHVIEREVVKEVPVAAPPPEPPPPPRKPYKLGALYDDLPTPCMKMIEGGASYYHCSGEWYRQVGGQYAAVKAP